jgi:phosphoribosyl 1,2-cyclic phosphate phosphodiesterase
VRYCLQTHAHADHLDPSHLLSRSPGYGVPRAPRLHFYASAATVQRVAQALEADVAPASLLDPRAGDELNLEVQQVAALQTVTFGPYRVTAFPANHDPTVEPLLYAIEADGRAIFYGTDTAPLAEETWHAFHDHKLRFDVVVLDHTYGAGEWPDDHLSARQFVEHVTRLREEGLLVDGARAFATHLAHASTPVHPELVEYAARHGYEIAYDGLTV